MSPAALPCNMRELGLISLLSAYFFRGYTSAAISITTTSGSFAGALTIRNVRIQGCPIGIRVGAASPVTSPTLTISNLFVHFATTAAIDVFAGTVVIYSSELASNANAVVVESGSAVVNVFSSTISKNTAAFTVNAGATLRVSGNYILDNGSAFTCGTGSVTLASAADNRITGTVGCSSNAVVSLV